MFTLLALVCTADVPQFEVVNRCPPVVVNKMPTAPVAKTGYPLRGSWWTGCPNWTHLANGEHRGKFPAEWLKTLSNAEVQSLHSDDHEGRVKWEYVPGHEAKAATPVQSYVVPSYYPAVTYSTCPTGNCPQRR